MAYQAGDGFSVIQVASYTLEEVFDAPRADKTRRVLPDGHTFRLSDRIRLFATKGASCVTCGLTGSIFVLETQQEGITPHLNLYAVTEEGKYILMTKDHIHPKSKGGANALHNYNPMCSPCNGKKADKV